MASGEQTSKSDCGTAFPSVTPRRVTKPKIFYEAMHVRLPGGTKERIDALRGNTRQGDFVRQVLMDGLDQLETAAGEGKGAKAKAPKTERNSVCSGAELGQR